MTKAIKYNDAALVKATGKKWKQWMYVFKKIKANNLAHKEIALLLIQDYEISGWWAQSLTVRFERETGKRIPGERSDGSFQVTISTTKDGSTDDIFEKWINKYADYSSFNKIKITGAPVTTTTPKWRYWKIKLADKSRLSVNFADKPNGKTLIQVNLDNLSNEAGIEKWRTYWKKELSAF